MNIGHFIELEGYHKSAHAEVTHGGGPDGVIILLCNESSHYILVAAENLDSFEGRILAIWDYALHDEELTKRYYIDALNTMITEAFCR